MDDVIKMLTYVFNAVEDALKSDDSDTVKVGMFILGMDSMKRAVIGKVVPIGCAEIIASNWDKRLRGEFTMTCHAVETLEARHQFAARPKADPAIAN